MNFLYFILYYLCNKLNIMNIDSIKDFKSKCSHMRFIPCDFVDDSKIRFRATYKNKKSQITIASFLCDSATEHVDEIHYSKKTCNPESRIFKALAICLSTGDWVIDNDTKHYWSIRSEKFNKETHKYDKFHTLEQINNIFEYESI